MVIEVTSYIQKGRYTMILTIDVGNTHIVLGMYKQDKLAMVSRMRTSWEKTGEEYGVLMRSILRLKDIEPSQIEGVIISSVVPPVTTTMEVACSLLVPNRNCVVVGPGVKTGLNIKIDNPAQLGADLVATGVATMEKYHLPAIVIDLGTATKITVIDSSGSFCGGSIAPGVAVALQALSDKASQLPDIALAGDVKICGTNTIDCMRSGVVLGAASMIDGMIDRYVAELGEFKTIVACGGLVGAIIPHCRHNITISDNLLLDGLYIIYKKSTAQ